METGPAFASLMIEAIADGVSVVDAGGHPLIVNQALCDMTGFSREELLARQPFAYPFWPAEEHGHISATFRRMQAGELGPYELVFCRKSGERFPVSIAPGVATADGERVFITTIKDLTELRREQERVRELSRLVDAMIQAGDLATWEWDLVTDEMHLSQSWYTMLGLPSGPAVTSTGAMIERVHPDDFDATQDSIGALLMGHRPLYEVEHRLRSVDGSWRWFLARGVVMERGADGRPSRIGGTNQDIHRIKQQEAFLQQWQKLEVLGELTGGIAHDFNNALMVLQSNTGLLRMDGYPEQQEGLDDMDESLVRAAALTESLQRYVHR